VNLRYKHRLNVYENRVLRRIFGPVRDVIVQGWRKRHNEELDNIYSSPNIIKMIKSRRIRWEHIQVFGGKARRKDTFRKT
jgi:hypothetical protein